MSVLLEQLRVLAATQAHVVLAIDGRCGSGKTTLAGKIAQTFPCNVVHMDDFFLPPAQRTPARMAQPGWNVDEERLIGEVLAPLSCGQRVAFRAFDCHQERFSPPVQLPHHALTIVEGSYSLRPALRPYYTHTCFLTCTPQEQARRLALRETPQKFQMFETRWIPMEEAYFNAYLVAYTSDFALDTTHLSEENLL